VLRHEKAALLEHAGTIDAVAEFCAWMLWYYISDRTTLLPYAAKSYSRDIVATVYAVMVLTAFGASMRTEKRVMTLSQQQTEEWKGWMQARL
jgi:N-acetylneuraminate 9-O-acetyltransferase